MAGRLNDTVILIETRDTMTRREDYSPDTIAAVLC
jgi:hypothetical protein